MDPHTFSPQRSTLRRQSRSPKKNTSPLKQVLLREAQRAQAQLPIAPETPTLPSPNPSRVGPSNGKPSSLEAENIRLTPRPLQARPLKSWERQPRAAQKNGKSRKIWKRPLAIQQGQNGEQPSQNTRARAKELENNAQTCGPDTPKKILKKVRLDSNTPHIHEDGERGMKVKQHVVGRERRRSSLPLDKPRSTNNMEIDVQPGESDEVVSGVEPNVETQGSDSSTQEVIRDGAELVHETPLESENEGDTLSDETQRLVRASLPDMNIELLSANSQALVNFAAEPTEQTASGGEDSAFEQNPQSVTLSESFRSSEKPIQQTDFSKADIHSNIEDFGASSGTPESVDPRVELSSSERHSTDANIDAHRFIDIGANDEETNSHSRGKVCFGGNLSKQKPEILEGIVSESWYEVGRTDEVLADESDHEDLPRGVEDETIVIEAPAENVHLENTSTLHTASSNHATIDDEDSTDHQFSPLDMSKMTQLGVVNDGADSDDTSSTLSSTELDAMLADDTATIKPSQVQNDTGLIQAPSPDLSVNSHTSSPSTPKASPGPKTELEHTTSPASLRSPQLHSPPDAAVFTPSQTSKLPLNDDETLLHDFLARSKASKAAKIASQEQAAQRRDSDAIKNALSNQLPLDEVTVNATPPLKSQTEASADPLIEETNGGMCSPTLVLDFNPPVVPAPPEEPPAAGSPKQSKRRKRHTTKNSDDNEDELTAPTRISLRHPPHVPTVARKTEAQQLALSTRTNTRFNRGSAVPVKKMLDRMKSGVPAAEEEAEISEEKNTNGKREVRWREELVSYFMEKQRPMQMGEGIENADASVEDVDFAPASKKKVLRAGGTPVKSRTRTSTEEDVGESEISSRSLRGRKRARVEDRETMDEAGGVEVAATEATEEAAKGEEVVEPAARPKRSGLPRRMSVRKR
ncbi:MAG: hypothetical protein Q9159_000493 [Coniocarpon cinnabarinum]